MIRWCLKTLEVIDTDGQPYQDDVRRLEYLENGKWIEVPEVDERGEKIPDPPSPQPDDEPFRIR